MIAPSYQITLGGEITGLKSKINLSMCWHICSGEYPDHIKGAYPNDSEGEVKGFLQNEAWEARECAVQATVRAVKRVI